MRLLIFILFFSFSSFAFGQINASFSHKQFFVPQQGSFVETYVNVFSPSLVHAKLDSTSIQAKIQVTQIFKQADSIVAFQKTNLNGPIVKDTNFRDILHQERFALNPGKYGFELIIEDLNATENNIVTTNETILIREIKDNLAVSDIELLEEFGKAEETTELTKSGYNMVPLVNNYYPEYFDKIAFYYEIYNADKQFGEGEKYVVKQYIESAAYNTLYGDLLKLKRMDAQPVNAMLHLFNIQALPTGDYNLVVEIRDKENQLLELEKVNFYRFNPLATLNTADIENVDIKESFVVDMIPKDSLDYFLAAMRPRATKVEGQIMDTKLEQEDTEFKQKFFYTFWKNRDQAEPGKKWMEYREQIYLTNDLFSTSIREGFETDRGRIYLKYGAPNTIADRPNEPSSYPYQVWHYYKIGRFNNKRFVFYQPDLVTNDYELLHSDLQGEITNYRWKLALQRRDSPAGSIDDPSTGNSNHYGGNSGEFFNLPR